MKVLNVQDGLGLFDQWFEEAEQSLFKAELLQDYSGVDDGPSLQSWRAGDRDLAVELARQQAQPWLEQRRAVSTPITRARVIERPFCDYLEWQLACIYPLFQSEQLETIRFVSKANLENVLMPYGDFWIFDERRVIEWTYDGPANSTAGAMVVEGRHAVDRYMALRDELLDNVEELNLP